MNNIEPKFKKSIWDITTNDFGDTWNFRFLKNLNSFSGKIEDLQFTASCQAAIDYKGENIFYIWVDDLVDTKTFNMRPNLWTFHYSIYQENFPFNNLLEISSNHPKWNGKIINPTLSPFMPNDENGNFKPLIIFIEIDENVFHPVFNWFIQFPFITSKQNNEETSLNFKVFPNPANNLLNIHLNGNKILNFQLEIMDILGNKIFEKNYYLQSSLNDAIDISQFPSGLYILQLKNQEKNGYCKIVKK